jgi:glutamate-1-semialdehyde 2,1-aminomutase
MRNIEIFNESKKYMPGGVNSPVRAFKDVTVNPPVIKKGYGAYLLDEEDKEYVDFLGAWGPMILGHSDEDVVKVLKATCESAQAFGAITELELKMARHICTTVDNMEMIRMVNSGTEATMSAVKLARGFTGRDKIVKFAGCYHGHFEGFLISAGSGVMTEGIPGCAGVPKDSIKNTLIAKYNDIENIKYVFEKYGEEIAAVIIEPVAGNMGVVPAKQEFLVELSRLCKKNGTVLIFDEVMSGFRVSYKGAQGIYGVAPDLITIGKIMGGGLPCGAYGGKAEIMKMLSPLGPVYQAGTMSGNPMVMAAGLETLTKLHNNQSYYSHLEKMAKKLENGVLKAASEKGLPVHINRCKSMMTIFFTNEGEVENYEDALKCDTKLYARFFEHMLKGGIYMSPSQFEAMFFSVKHTVQDIEKFIDVFRKF